MSTTEPPTAGPTPETPPANDTRFFSWMRSLGIRRQDGWIGGVAGGIAQRTGIDPLIVRGILVVLALFGAPALLLYAAAWLLLPDSGNKIHLEEAIAGRFEAPLAGIGAMVALSFIPAAPGLWFFPGYGDWGNWGSGLGRGIWTLLLIGALVWFLIWVAQRSNGTPTPTATSFTTPEPPAPPTGALPEDVAAWRTSQAEWKAQHANWRNQQATAASQEARARARAASAERARLYNEERERSRPNHLVSFIVVGTAILVGAIVALAVGGGETFDVSVMRASLGSALAVLGLGVLAAGALGKRSGGPGGFAVPVIVVLVATSGVPLGGNFSPVAADGYSPRNDTSETRSTDNYVLGGGSTTLDLRDYYNSSASTTGTADPDDRINFVMGGGSLRVIVPDDQYVDLTATMGGGRLAIEQNDNVRTGGPLLIRREEFIPEGFEQGDEFTRTLELNIIMGGGSIDVVSAGTATEDEN
ncbi:PspC domain-containing protein [Glaciihabitans arcticus]|uniref:PspC domain-containing protein n=1 Tax=Glaciihabitans arcticus TaxID=2668039 RepID=A0A4Q9GME7_9MICO|nr:PspC domain-containing protein [Glaciihabitans arcticus]TBN55508.1 PspC domain-containing protein [Glaciihabitans arcticus]